MSASAVRRAVFAVCVVGIAGMIVTNIADNSGGSMTFGLVTAAAVLCLIVATAVSRPAGGDSEELGASVEAGISAVVAQGADEDDVRALVADAVRLGRATR